MISVKNLSKAYAMGPAKVQALQEVSLDVESGDFIAIMGPSGSGKSTLMHILGFLDRPDQGTYLFNGRDISHLSDDQLALVRNQTAGFVFQQFHLLSRVSALDNVALPLTYAGRHGQKQKAAQQLDAVGLGKRMSHQPNELSGGERQRVAIARALVNDPAIIFADEPTGNLDTKSEAEIIAILKKLNEDGKTIVMVTHEIEVAAHAKRVITMRDGWVISDVRQAPVQAEKPLDLGGTDAWFDKGQAAQGQARLTDHLRQSWDAILAHKMRSLLSMLGILIGVTAVIAMLALGEGAKESISSRLASLGSNMLMVRAGPMSFQGMSLGSGSVSRLTFSDAAAIRDLPTVFKVSANVQGKAQAVYNENNWNTQVQGVGLDYEIMRASTPTSGRFFTSAELSARARVALVGTTVVSHLFKDQDPIGKTIKVNRSNFTVIGVLPVKGSGGFNDNDDVIVVPVTTAMYRIFGKQYIDSLDVQIKEEPLMDEATEQITELLNKRFKVGKNDLDAFQIRNMTQIREVISSTTKTMTMLLGVIAAISLLVGGIGIMNIMLVSVTERTREIGLRKAIGARRADITAQFLIEAVIMTVVGGLLGVLLGIGIALLLSLAAGWATKVSWVAVVGSMAFSACVGIIFGLRPAMKAAALNPIEALRFE